MPRKMLPLRKAQAALLALRVESARREAVTSRREHHAREAALALRKATPDWVDMNTQLNQLQLEVEMDAMEAAIDDRRPKIPVLNKAIIANLITSSSLSTSKVTLKPPALALTADEIAYKTIKRSAPPNGKRWKHHSTSDGRYPADDWRNYE